MIAEIKEFVRVLVRLRRIHVVDVFGYYILVLSMELKATLLENILQMFQVNFGITIKMAEHGTLKNLKALNSTRLK